MQKKLISILIAILAFFPAAYAFSFKAGTSYSVCFTPGGNCTQNIVNTIQNATQSIYVQAYSFTSRPIGRALISAKKRGVNVKIIFDKSILQHSSTAWNFIRSGIPVWIDYLPAIAHNKVMIIDNKYVITGSFNFTYAAQNKNAENLLIIKDPDLAQKYLANWEGREAVSRVMSLSQQPKPSRAKGLEYYEDEIERDLKGLLMRH